MNEYSHYDSWCTVERRATEGALLAVLTTVQINYNAVRSVLTDASDVKITHAAMRLIVFLGLV